MRRAVPLRLFPIAFVLFLASCVLSKEMVRQNYLEEGIILYEEKRFPDALIALDKATQQDPELVEAYFRKGVIFQVQNKVNQAVIAYNDTLRHDPHHYKAYYNLGNIYLHEKHNKEQAIHYYRKFLDIIPNHVLAQQTRNQLLTLIHSDKSDTAATPPPGTSDFLEVRKHIRDFKAAYERKDLSWLGKNTTMSPTRQGSIQHLFNSYNLIELSLSDPFFTTQELDSVSVIVTFTKLVDKRGNLVTPGDRWKETVLNIRKEKGDYWGKIQW